MPSSVTGVQTCRSEEHTSELQSHDNLVCRLLLEKKQANSQISRVPAPSDDARCPPHTAACEGGRGRNHLEQCRVGDVGVNLGCVHVFFTEKAPEGADLFPPPDHLGR